MSFVQELSKLSWGDIEHSIANCRAADVRRALGRRRRELEDFFALVSPAAEDFLEEMAAAAKALTLKRFGKTIQLYVPVYLSNVCENRCTYCGFSASNPRKRVILKPDDIAGEAAAVKAMGYEHLLLVTGESRKVGCDYLERALNRLRPHFANLSLEVQPLGLDEYRRLRRAGLHAVMIYQETYHRPTYDEVHVAGPKKDYNWRVETPDRLGQAGVHKIGLGTLIGLADWRTDAAHVAAHLRYLQGRYWRTKFSISFPRLRPCEGLHEPPSPMNERQLVQLLCAYRLFDGEVELSLSTRERPHFRDNVLGLGITTLSAGSRTDPGGYQNRDEQLEQFSVHDDRSAAQMAAVIKAHGYEAVWKDWDASYDADVDGMTEPV